MATDFNFSPIIIFYLIFISVWINYAIQTYLFWRQRKVLKTFKVIPPKEEIILNQITEEETFKQARKYGLATNSLLLGSILYYSVIFTVILIFELIWLVWNKSCDIADQLSPPSFHIFSENAEARKTLIFIVIITGLQIFAMLPINLYGIYIEQKHGINKKTGLLVEDLITNIVLKILILPISLVGITTVFQMTGRHLWCFPLIAWGLKFVDFLMLNNLFCCCTTMKDYNKLKPLDEGSLRTNLRNLATRMNFPLQEILIMKSSIRSLHSNAYLYGICCGKRIVLLDKLFAKEQEGPEINRLVRFTDEDIEMIVCHEMGHWALNHIWKIFIFSQLNIAVTYILTELCFYNVNLTIAFGFAKVEEEQDQPVIAKLLLILIYVLGIYNIVWSGLYNAYTRKTEYDADAFVIQNLDNNFSATDRLKSAVLKLHKNYLEFPFVDPFYALIYCPQPNVLFRLEAIEKFAREQSAFV